MTQKLNRLAIATPTFGKGHFLADCLESIRAQTISVECCLCDGGTQFDFSDSRWGWVKRRSFNPDPGLVTCWNAAAELSETPYLSFLADDNALEPRFAEVMTDFMESHPECDAAFCNQSAMDEAGVVNSAESERIAAFYGRAELAAGVIPCDQNAFLFQKNAIPLEACVLTRQAWQKYGPFRPQAHGALDLDLFTRMLAGGARFGFVPEALTRFRFHEGAYTARKREEHLRGMVWSMQGIHSTDPALETAIRLHEIQLSGRLLRAVSGAEVGPLARGLTRTSQGRKVLVKALAARALKRKI